MAGTDARLAKLDEARKEVARLEAEIAARAPRVFSEKWDRVPLVKESATRLVKGLTKESETKAPEEICLIVRNELENGTVLPFKYNKSKGEYTDKHGNPLHTSKMNDVERIKHYARTCFGLIRPGEPDEDNVCWKLSTILDPISDVNTKINNLFDLSAMGDNFDIVRHLDPRDLTTLVESFGFNTNVSQTIGNTRYRLVDPSYKNWKESKKVKDIVDAYIFDDDQLSNFIQTLPHFINTSQILNRFEPCLILKVGDDGKCEYEQEKQPSNPCHDPQPPKLTPFCFIQRGAQTGGKASQGFHVDAYNRLPTLNNIHKFHRGQSGGNGDFASFGMFPGAVVAGPKIEFRGSSKEIKKMWENAKKKMIASKLTLTDDEMRKLDGHVNTLVKEEEFVGEFFNAFNTFQRSGQLATYGKDNNVDTISLEDMKKAKNVYDKLNNRRYPICINAFLAIQKKLEECLEKNP